MLCLEFPIVFHNNFCTPPPPSVALVRMSASTYLFDLCPPSLQLVQEWQWREKEWWAEASPDTIVLSQQCYVMHYTYPCLIDNCISSSGID